MTVNIDQCVRVPQMQPDVDQLPDSSVVDGDIQVQQSEFVIDRIVGHGVDPDDKSLRVRVRWHEYI
jgi:hypothetical protein